MREFDNGSFDPTTTAVLKAAFDDAQSVFKLTDKNKAERHELARCILRLAMEGERDPVHLRDNALLMFGRAVKWRRAS